MRRANQDDESRNQQPEARAPRRRDRQQNQVQPAQNQPVRVQNMVNEVNVQGVSQGRVEMLRAESVESLEDIPQRLPHRNAAQEE